jgi:DNA mismatch repair ATPase MutS
VLIGLVISGITNKSYGIHVAEIAGMPKPVVTRAFEILHKFLANDSLATGTTILSPRVNLEPVNTFYLYTNMLTFIGT